MVLTEIDNISIRTRGRKGTTRTESMPPMIRMPAGPAKEERHNKERGRAMAGYHERKVTGPELRRMEDDQRNQPG